MVNSKASDKTINYWASKISKLFQPECWGGPCACPLGNHKACPEPVEGIAPVIGVHADRVVLAETAY